jgi:hypothetical protein
VHWFFISHSLRRSTLWSFAAQVDGNFAQNQMLAKLPSLFELLALVLASVVLYGVTVYWVERHP